MKNLNKRARMLLAIAGVVIVVVVAGGYILTMNGLVELPLVGSAYVAYLDPPELCVNPGSTRTLTQMNTTWGVNRWSSANTAIATVTATGKKTANVTGVSVGDTTVTAKGTFFSDTAAISVRSVCPYMQDIPPNASIQAVTNLTGGEWRSFDAAIASVDSDGTIYARSLGRTTIIYVMPDQQSSDKIVSVTVTNTPHYRVSW